MKKPGKGKIYIFLVPFGQSCNRSLPCLTDRHWLVVWPFGNFPNHTTSASLALALNSLAKNNPLVLCMSPHTHTNLYRLNGPPA